MIKYKTWLDEISKVEITRESKSSVWIKGWGGKERRILKVATAECIFDTFNDAKAFLVAKATQRIERTKENLERAELKLKKIERLTDD